MATIDTTDANTTATYGDPKVDNTATYRVGTPQAGLQHLPARTRCNLIGFQRPIYRRLTEVIA